MISWLLNNSPIPISITLIAIILWGSGVKIFTGKNLRYTLLSIWFVIPSLVFVYTLTITLSIVAYTKHVVVPEANILRQDVLTVGEFEKKIDQIVEPINLHIEELLIRVKKSEEGIQLARTEDAKSRRPDTDEFSREIRKDLSSGTIDRKSAAILLAAQTGRSQFLDDILGILKDDTEATEVRRHAVAALVSFDETRSVPSLIEVLSNEAINETLTGEIVTALGKLGDRRATQPLIAFMKDRSQKPRQRGAAATSLYYLKDPEAVPALIEMIDDPEDDVKGTAITALGELGDRRATQPLIAFMKDRSQKPDNRGAAATSLYYLKDPEAVPALIEMIYDPEDDVKGAAITALGELGDQRATDPLIAFMKDQTQKPRLRGSAAVALGTLGDHDAFEPLVKLLKNANNPRLLRIACAFALDKLENPLVRSAFQEQLLKEKDAEVQRIILMILRNQ